MIRKLITLMAFALSLGAWSMEQGAGNLLPLAPRPLLLKKTPVPTPRVPKYVNTIGVFEGGGYEAKGIYAPHMDCLMKTLDGDHFCPVCQRAIERMILYYSR